MNNQRLCILGVLLFCAGLGLANAENLRDLKLQGELTQGSLIRGQAEAGASILLDGKPLKVGPAGEFVFGIGRDETQSKLLQIAYSNGDSIERTLAINPRTFDIQKIEGISKKIMNPDPKAIERSKKDNRMVAAARAPITDELDFTQDFIWPVKGPISGVYGSQRVFNGVPKRPHYGVDVAVPTGTEIVSPADGQVTLWVPDMFYSGGTMIIDHGFGVSSTFLHLSGALVKQGDVVSQGQPVALVGATGRVTGAHLDWRMNWRSVRVDPQLLVPAMDAP
ncbi:M23 family metallopeptidase [Echinimonas agarilytica]|uniref:M23 family metallopeptidase n=1 Tax=Echinimonas agarilytica TaxID=1215918 RepID=A0AA41W6A9_9GAMM|nr:M23 family metallopeptidase [Echinimonas agarilytica]MCM2679845.1 M23 family metallopeptidase [Echinimonas agarilytica]